MAAADTFHASRVATGDWVVLRRPDPGPLGFLGKVTDGEWDQRDDALLRARVDTTTKPAWLAAGDLERVEPADEAGLVEAALLEGLVPDDRPGGRAERLRADVAALRAGALTFVRSPGLLDRLWAALPTEPTRRSGGLAAFFDEGQRALRDVRQRRWAPAPPAAPDLPDLPDDFHIVDDPSFEEAAPLPSGRPKSQRDVVERILRGLPRWSLAGVVVRLERPDLRQEPAETIRTELLDAGLTVDRLLGALSPFMIRTVPRLLGLPDVKGLADRTIQAWLVGTFRHLPAAGRDDAPVGAAAPLPPLPRWAPPAAPTSEADAVWRVLGLVRARELAGVCQQVGAPGLAGLRGARAKCEALALTDRGLRRLLPALPARALQHAAWALGAEEVRGTEDAVAAELARRAPTERGPRAPAPAGDDLLLPHVVAALSLAELGMVLVGLPSAAPADPATLAPALRAEGRGARDILGDLGPGALRRVATAVGVPASIDGPERLHAAILSLEPSPFA